ncbi:hypothetical protein CJ468_06496 [Nocardia farcinica]|nr:hypothetical protein CJ468_06496 [Nocardia farcinica]
MTLATRVIPCLDVDAGRVTTSNMVARSPLEAVTSRKVSSSAPWAS